jgi:gamma-glutamyltranspeptidase / glutathione hydrolase
VILRDGRPVVAMGATGGRRIPNTLVDVLAELVGRDQPLARAFATPRLHTEGDATLAFGKGFSDVEIERLKRVGYTIKSGGGASLNAIARDPASVRLDHVPPEQRA